MIKNYNQLVENWQLKTKDTVMDLDACLSNFRIMFAYNSNAIENPETTYHDTREIFENGQVLGYTGELRTLFEIHNQKITYEYLLPLIFNKTPLTIDLIEAIHKKLMNGCYDETRYSKGERPGAFKANDYIVGDNVETPAEDVPEEIEELCNEINNARNADPLTLAAYFHLNFESIHPFADGNGRVGRTLMNYILMINNHPPMIIYNEDKKTYYLALAVFDKTGNLEGFKEFLKEQSCKTWALRPKIKKGLTL